MLSHTHRLQLESALSQGLRAVMVTIEAVQGSAPREAGTVMAVLEGGATHAGAVASSLLPGLIGTIGGGHLEWQAYQQAREALRSGHLPASQRFALGPSLGQCCGGAVTLSFHWATLERLQTLEQAALSALQAVVLFGGGHVGRALVQVLTRLPFRLLWIDSRDAVFPSAEELRAWPQVQCESCDPVQDAVADFPSQARVLIMSFSHAEDLDVVAACLRRQRQQQDLPFIGLIGSKTKWATFSHRLAERGFSPAELAQVTCPIGVPGIHGKQPEVIAVAVAAQLLQTLTP